MLQAAEAAEHVDEVFLGEAEGGFDKVIDDVEKGRLQKVYNFCWFNCWIIKTSLGSAVICSAYLVLGSPVGVSPRRSVIDCCFGFRNRVMALGIAMLETPR